MGKVRPRRVLIVQKYEDIQAWYKIISVKRQWVDIKSFKNERKYKQGIILLLDCGSGSSPNYSKNTRKQKQSIRDCQKRDSEI